MDLEALKTALREGRVIITQHADTEAKADGLNLTEMRASVLNNGELIERLSHRPTRPKLSYVECLA